MKTALAQQNPFEGLPEQLAAAYQQERQLLSDEVRQRRVIALMLASYFASERPNLGGTGTPIDVFCQAIIQAGGSVTSAQKMQHLDTVSFAPARYGVICTDEAGEELIVPAIDVLHDSNKGTIYQRQQLLADKIKAAEVAILPMVAY